MPKLTINGKEVEVAEGTNLIEATKLVDKSIPHFCYHPGLSIAGNCRMCLVDIEGARKLEIACNTQVRDGMIVSTDSEKVLKARQGVMEFLLLNHPIDCPICDCAGECSLQDYYMEHDTRASRLEEPKNKKEKAKEIGQHVMLDKERCVLCSRCVRFTDEISKTSELGIFGRGSTEEIGLVDGITLDNSYSGNVVDLCPVGALTDKNFRFKSRPWYLGETETICAGCSNGCNIVLNTNKNPYNKVGQDRAYRIFPREYRCETNDYWICDEGRYSYEAMDKGLRIDTKAYGNRKTRDFIDEQAAAGLKSAIEGDPGKVAFLLSPQMSNEELWAWKWLAEKTGVTQIEVGDDLKTLGSADDFLIKADKNPNSKGAADLGLGPRKGVQGGKEVLKGAASGKWKALVVVEHAIDSEVATATPTLIHIASHAADNENLLPLAMPRCQYVEQDGTFKNHAGKVQKANKAMEALGDSRPAWAIAFEIGKRLGLEVPAVDFESIQTAMGATVRVSA